VTPFDIVNIIYNKTEHDREEVLGDYNEWLINHALSNNMDTLLFAQEMSQFNHLPKDIQFDFYQFGIPKGKRFGKWHKAEKTDDALITALCSNFNCNNIAAKQYLKLMNDDQKKLLLQQEGGK